MSRGFKIALIVAACAIAAIAIGSGVRAQQPPDPVATLTEDWNAYLTAQKHVVGSISAVANELQKTRAEMAAKDKELGDLKAQLEKLKAESEKKP